MTGREVKQIRTKLRLTQTELAEQLGVTQSAVSQWEDNKRQVKGAAVVLLKRLRDAAKSEKLATAS